jgi:hypothetical protein
MTKEIKIIVTSGLVLFSVMALAQAAKKSTTKPEHHSRLSKVAFWRHHKDSTNNVKPTPAAQSQAKQVKTKPAQVKGVSAKQSATTKNQMPEQHAAKKKTAPAKKAALTKTKNQQKAQNSSTASK